MWNLQIKLWYRDEDSIKLYVILSIKKEEEERVVNFCLIYCHDYRFLRCYWIFCLSYCFLKDPDWYPKPVYSFACDCHIHTFIYFSSSNGYAARKVLDKGEKRDRWDQEQGEKHINFVLNVEFYVPGTTYPEQSH